MDELAGVGSASLLHHKECRTRICTTTEEKVQLRPHGLVAEQVWATTPLDWDKEDAASGRHRFPFASVRSWATMVVVAVRFRIRPHPCTATSVDVHEKTFSLETIRASVSVPPSVLAFAPASVSPPSCDRYCDHVKRGIQLPALYSCVCSGRTEGDRICDQCGTAHAKRAARGLCSDAAVGASLCIARLRAQRRGGFTHRAYFCGVSSVYGSAQQSFRG